MKGFESLNSSALSALALNLAGVVSEGWCLLCLLLRSIVGANFAASCMILVASALSAIICLSTSSLYAKTSSKVSSRSARTSSSSLLRSGSFSHCLSMPSFCFTFHCVGIMAFARSFVMGLPYFSYMFIYWIAAPHSRCSRSLCIIFASTFSAPVGVNCCDSVQLALCGSICSAGFAWLISSFSMLFTCLLSRPGYLCWTCVSGLW